jgi:hypothetical protein
MGDEVDLVPLITTIAEVGAALLKFLPPLVQKFTAILQEIVDEALEGTNALTDKRLNLTNEARNIRRTIRAAVREGLNFVEKIDEFATIVLQRNNVTQIKLDVRNLNYSRLTELLWQISVCLNRATGIHEKFQEKCNLACGLCASLVEVCSSNAYRARNRRRTTQIGGGLGSGLALVGSVGVAVGGTITSVIAGVLTGGAAAAVGLPLTATATVALAGTGAAGAVATAILAERYEQIASRFSLLSNSLVSMGNISEDLIEHINELKTALTNKQETSDEITHWLEHDGHTHTEAICSALGRLVEICRSTQESTSPCREMLRGLRDRLKRLDLSY